MDVTVNIFANLSTGSMQTDTPIDVYSHPVLAIVKNPIYKAVQVTLLTIVVILSLLGNTFSIVVINKARDINTTTKIYMFSLAVCYICIDLSFGIPLIGSTIVGDWPYGPGLCHWFCFGMVWFNTGSLCILFVLNLDRLIAVTRPLHYDSIMPVWKAALMASIAWIASLIFAILNAFLPYQKAFYKPDYLFCFFDPYTDEIVDIIGMSNVLILIVFPIIAVIVIYRKIYKVAKFHAAAIAAIDNRVQGQEAGDRKRMLDTKAAKAFLMVTVGFVLSWFPFIVGIGYEYVVNVEPPILPWWSELCVIFGTLINVIIYYWKNEAFRRPARKLMPRSWRRVAPEVGDSSVTESTRAN
ncbi:beta-1 adrenergic receptor-like [Amphiura filiformis]|uniref:beta-1 adrenergic receptor-like n=1 Tax=Amphiura filiformis TaxID=82378 RepID=UPI003B2197F2